MRFSVLSVGKPKHGFIKDASEHYARRVRAQAELTLNEVKDFDSDPDREGRALESVWERLSASEHTRLIVLDEQGQQMPSRKFSEWIAQQEIGGVSRLVFLIGGAYGVSDALKQKAHFTLSLSTFTFPHDLARVLVLEQIYRALQIRSGSRYHHD